MNHVAQLLQTRRQAIGLSIADVVRRTPYRNINRGIRHLTAMEAGEPKPDARLLDWFGDALGIDATEVHGAVAADKDAAQAAQRAQHENEVRLYRLIIAHKDALVARDPWTLVPFAMNGKFGERRTWACIGAVSLLWNRASDLQPTCSCGGRFHIVGWWGAFSIGGITAFCPGCGTYRKVFDGGAAQCSDRLKPYFAGTEFEMNLGCFPGTYQPPSTEILDALAALGVDISGIDPLEAGHQGAFAV